MRSALAMLAVAALALLLPGPCQGAQGAGAPPAVRADYHGTGVVIALMPPPSSLHATRPVIIIHHSPIPPLMPEEMDMPFIAASVALFENLHPGDRITFALKDTSDALLVVAIERVGARADH
jgi:hypothetical protein